MGDNHLPLEQRIGSVRDGDTTDHGTPIGSTPLKVQPPRRLGMDTPHPLGGDIVATLNEIMYYGTFPEGSVYGQAILEAADEIERLRVEVRSQALELLVAHSEALDLYNLTTPTDKEST